MAKQRITAKQIISDIKWRIKDHKQNIKFLEKNYSKPYSSDIKDEIYTRQMHIDAYEMVLRGFNLID